MPNITGVVTVEGFVWNFYNYLYQLTCKCQLFKIIFYLTGVIEDS